MNRESSVVDSYLRKSLFSALSAFCLIFVSCQNENKNHQNFEQLDQKKLKEKLISANKIYYKNQDEEIDAYISRLGYDMQKTATGVRWMIYKPGTGKQAASESEVEVKYTVQLTDGTFCYSSDSTGNLEFKIGHSDLPTGFQQGISLLKEGDKAIIIAPSNLGYGLTGDGGKIGSNAILVYDVELIDVK